MIRFIALSTRRIDWSFVFLKFQAFRVAEFTFSGRGFEGTIERKRPSELGVEA